MKLSDGRIPGTNAKVKKTNKKSVNESIDAEIYKKAKVENNYNELSILFSGDYSLVFRVYNDGMAYRFETNFKKTVYC